MISQRYHSWRKCEDRESANLCDYLNTFCITPTVEWTTLIIPVWAYLELDVVPVRWFAGFGRSWSMAIVPQYWLRKIWSGHMVKMVQSCKYLVYPAGLPRNRSCVEPIMISLSNEQDSETIPLDRYGSCGKYDQIIFKYLNHCESDPRRLERDLTLVQ